MNIAAQISQQVLERENSLNARNFAHAAKWLVIGEGNWELAYKRAKEARALPAILECLKAAAPPLGTSGASALVPYTTLANAFLLSLRSSALFDAAKPFMISVPFRTKIAVVSGGATGSTMPEGNVKLVSKLSLSASQMTEMKTVAMVAVSDEVLREADTRLFQRVDSLSSGTDRRRFRF